MFAFFWCLYNYVTCFYLWVLDKASCAHASNYNLKTQNEQKTIWFIHVSLESKCLQLLKQKKLDSTVSPNSKNILRRLENYEFTSDYLLLLLIDTWLWLIRHVRWLDTTWLLDWLSIFFGPRGPMDREVQLDREVPRTLQSCFVFYIYSGPFVYWCGSAVVMWCYVLPCLLLDKFLCQNLFTKWRIHVNGHIA